MRRESTVRSLVWVCALGFAACTPAKYTQRRQTLADEARWLASAFDDRAAKATGAGDQLLGSACKTAADRCRAIVVLCEDTRATFLSDPRKMADLEDRLQAVRDEVDELEKLRSRGQRLLHAMGSEFDRLQNLPAPAAAVDRAERSNQQLAYATGCQQLLEARTVDALRVAIADAEGELRKSKGEAPTVTEATRHGQLKAVVDGELARVASLLTAERKKKEDSSRVRKLEEAEASLQKAKTMLAPTATPNRFVLDEAETALDAARTSMAKVQEDIVLYPSPWFRAHAGAISLSPYKLAPNTAGQFHLEKADGGPTFYLELDFFGREAWLVPEDQLARTPDYGLRFLADWLVPDDYEGRLRFTNSSKIDSDTSAVGGDLALDGLVGWNIVGIGLKDPHQAARDPALKKQPQGTINFEVGAGFVTDGETIDAHGYAQAGLGTVWSFPLQIAPTTYRMATLYMGLYYGVADFPQLDIDDVQHIDAQRPAYNSLGALGARIDAAIPITGAFDFVVGARYWDALAHDGPPESWSVFVGVSLPLGQIFDAVNSGS